MIQLIYGENSYLVSQKLREIEANFMNSDPSGINLQKLDGSAVTYSLFEQAISAMPFLADRRMVIVRNLMLDNKDPEIKNKITDRLFLRKNTASNNKEAADSTDIVFVEMGQPDKRTRLFKALQKEAVLSHCENLSGQKLFDWLAAQFKHQGLTIVQRELEPLAFEIGADMQMAINQIEKLSLYVKSQSRSEVTAADIKKMIKNEVDPDIFQFTEAIAKKDAAQAFKLWFQFMQNGESEHRMLSMLVYQFRTMIIVKEGMESALSQKEIASLAKLHPFAVQKNALLVRNKSIKKLIMMFDQLRRTEAAIKSGGVPSELAVDVLISSLCR